MSDRPDRLDIQPDIQSLTRDGNRPPEAEETIPPNWNYEATVVEIETIINQIELGELDLAEVFDQFATAVQQLRQCETFLTRQKQHVDLLIETLLDDPEPF